MTTLKVTTVGNSIGFILPKEARDMLGVEKGDLLHLTCAPDGSLRLTADDPEFERQMKVAEQVMRDHLDVFRELAK